MFRLILLVSICAAVAGGCDAIRTPDPEVVYVAFGDSSTAGPSTRDYPDILRERLGATPASFANEGESGESSGDGLERLRVLFDNGIFPNAEVLLYWEGGNDLIDFVGELDPLLLFSANDADYPFAADLENRLDDIQGNVQAAIRAGRDAGVDVFVATYYPLRESAAHCPAVAFEILLPAQAQRANEYVDLLNERIRNAAVQTGATLVDVAQQGAALTADGDNYYDCNHLSAAGNAIVADTFYDVITANR